MPILKRILSLFSHQEKPAALPQTDLARASVLEPARRVAEPHSQSLEPPQNPEAIPSATPVQYEPGDTETVKKAYDVLIFDQVMRVYYGNSRYYNVGYWGAGASAQEEASRDLVDRLLSQTPVSPKTVLDVACGLGETTFQVKTRWPEAEVIGINFSEQQIEACRERTAKCRFEVMDAADLKFDDGAFDLVLCVEAAMHFHTRLAFFAAAYRVLKPGGCLLLSDMLFVDQSWLESWHVPEENHLVDLELYRANLLAVGFTEIRIEDALDLTWRGWCRNLATWLHSESADEIDLEQRERWRTGVVVQQPAIVHYPLVYAVKPG